MRAKITYQDATNRIKLECGGYWSLKEAMECLLEMARKDQLGGIHTAGGGRDRG